MSSPSSTVSVPTRAMITAFVPVFASLALPAAVPVPPMLDESGPEGRLRGPTDASALLLIAHDPQARLRDIAEQLGITERTAFAVVGDLTASGYVIKEKDGRRNRYHVRGDLPVPGTVGRRLTVSELLELVQQEAAPRPKGAKVRGRRAAD
jgi:hypothetical protein